MSDLVNQSYQFKVNPESTACRIDVFLSQQNLGITRSHIQKLLEEDAVKVNGKKVKAAYKVKVNDVIELEIPSPQKIEAEPENIPIEILYQDKALAVINKPPGLVVHASAGHEKGTLVNALLFHLKDLSGIGGALRPGIVHRLDKDTSGIMLIAKNNQAHAELVRMFQNREIKKTYQALCYGTFKQDEGIVENKLGRSQGDRKKISSHTLHGKDAKTTYRVTERFPHMALVEAQPLTGRTHQIRVHFTELGHPIVGDPTYGGRHWVSKLEPVLQKMVKESNRQMLHAFRLELVHPITGKKLKFEADVPKDFEKILKTAKKLKKG